MFSLLYLSRSLFIWDLAHAQNLPRAVARIIAGDNPRGLWFILFLSLMPLALTLAILWRIKEVIFQSLFEQE